MSCIGTVVDRVSCGQRIDVQLVNTVNTRTHLVEKMLVNKYWVTMFYWIPSISRIFRISNQIVTSTLNLSTRSSSQPFSSRSLKFVTWVTFSVHTGPRPSKVRKTEGKKDCIEDWTDRPTLEHLNDERTIANTEKAESYAWDWEEIELKKIKIIIINWKITTDSERLKRDSDDLR